MVEYKKVVIGTLALLLSFSILYISMGGVKLRVDKNLSTFYVQNENNRWIVAGREYNKIFEGTSQKYRDVSEIKVESFIDEEAEIVRFVRTTPYKVGATIVDTYTFSGKTDDVKLFPIEHKVEIFNGTGLFYRYEVRDLDYSGLSYKLQGETELEFGLNMKLELAPDYRWAWVYKDGIVKAQYDIDSNYEVFYVRLFDPPSNYGDGSDGALVCTSGTVNLDLNRTFQYTYVDVGAGCTITTTNATGSVLYFLAQDYINITGTIDLSGIATIPNGQYSDSWSYDGRTFIAPSVANGGTGGDGGSQGNGFGGGGKGGNSGATSGGGGGTGGTPAGSGGAAITGHGNGNAGGTSAGGSGGQNCAAACGTTGAGGDGYNSNGLTGSGGTDYSMGGGGGGGGEAGKGGIHFFARALYINFTGTIDTSGTAGTNGGTGGNGRNPAATSRGAGFGGGGGGGSGGGNAGDIYFTTDNLLVNTGTKTMDAGAVGTGGTGGTGEFLGNPYGAGDGTAGSSGTVGTAGTYYYSEIEIRFQNMLATPSSPFNTDNVNLTFETERTYTQVNFEQNSTGSWVNYSEHGSNVVGNLTNFWFVLESGNFTAATTVYWNAWGYNGTWVNSDSNSTFEVSGKYTPNVKAYADNVNSNRTYDLGTSEAMGLQCWINNSNINTNMSLTNVTDDQTGGWGYDFVTGTGITTNTSYANWLGDGYYNLTCEAVNSTYYKVFTPYNDTITLRVFNGTSNLTTWNGSAWSETSGFEMPATSYKQQDLEPTNQNSTQGIIRVCNTNSNSTTPREPVEDVYVYLNETPHACLTIYADTDSGVWDGVDLSSSEQLFISSLGQGSCQDVWIAANLSYCPQLDTYYDFDYKHYSRGYIEWQ